MMAGAQDLKISVIQVLPKNDETKNKNLRTSNEEPQPHPLIQEIIGKDANYITSDYHYKVIELTIIQSYFF